MNFYELDDTIPRITEGELHSVINQYGDVQVKSPGKYASITEGGDFVVDTEIGGKWVPLRHKDFFEMVSEMTKQDPEWMRNKFAPALVMLSKGELDMDQIDSIRGGPFHRISPRQLLRTLTLILVAEHRRAPWAEPVGGRYLVIRFLLGIIYDVWPVDEAISYIKQGKPGLKKLRWRYVTEPTLNEVLKGVA